MANRCYQCHRFIPESQELCDDCQENVTSSLGTRNRADSEALEKWERETRELIEEHNDWDDLRKYFVGLFIPVFLQEAVMAVVVFRDLFETRMVLVYIGTVLVCWICWKWLKILVSRIVRGLITMTISAGLIGFVGSFIGRIFPSPSLDAQVRFLVHIFLPRFEIADSEWSYAIVAGLFGLVVGLLIELKDFQALLKGPRGR